ncbi:hypothetical protein [Nocardia sp. NPDC057440]|uniref:hypothetical protein n=1 Tax=Nocardia sp. NPDC057440 TaxID=3346134 RepID=UPI00366D619C
MGSDLDELEEPLDDFVGRLRQTNKSTGTIDTYSRNVRYSKAFLATRGLPTTSAQLTGANIGAYIEDTLARPNRRTGKPITPEFAHRQYRSLQQFCRYLAAEEIPLTDPFGKLAPPLLPDKPIPVPAVEMLRKLLAVCEGGCWRAGGLARCSTGTAHPSPPNAPATPTNEPGSEISCSSLPVAARSCTRKSATSDQPHGNALNSCKRSGTTTEGLTLTLRQGWSLVA